MSDSVGDKLTFLLDHTLGVELVRAPSEDKGETVALPGTGVFEGIKKARIVRDWDAEFAMDGLVAVELTIGGYRKKAFPGATIGEAIEKAYCWVRSGRGSRSRRRR